MKKIRREKRIYNLIIILVALLFIFAFPNKVEAKLENEDEIIARVQKDNDDNPESTAYLVTDEYVSNVAPETSIETFRKNIENGVTVYENTAKQKEVTEGIIKTGMVLEYNQNGRTFDISVLGDINGDGILNQIELTREIRDILKTENWKIEKEIEKLAGDIERDRKIDEKDTEAIINYIVFEKFKIDDFELVQNPQIDILGGDYKEDRYRGNVSVKIIEKNDKTKTQKTVYKVIGSEEKKYKEISGEEELKIETDGVFKVTAYTYGIEGNKSKGKSVLIIREKPTYTIKYSGGTQGTFEEQITDKLYEGDETPKFTGEIIGNPGYKFIGWSEEISEFVTGDKEYVAKWEAIEYKMEYELNGGILEEKTNPEIYTVETETFTLNNPSKKGYTFIGWTENDDEEPKLEVTIEKGTIKDKKYKANWKINVYTITYDLVFGKLEEGIENKTEYTVETESFTINNPTRIGYTFKGWTESDDEEAKLEVTVEKGTTGNKTFTANWIANEDTKYLIEIYEMDLNGEYIKISSQEKQWTSDTLAKVEKESKKGFTYDESLSKIEANIEPDGSTVLKIYYSRNKYKLTTDIGEGIYEVEGGNTYYYDADIKINAVVKNGYTWKNWISSDAELIPNSDIQNYNIKMPDSDITLTAEATLNIYTITYDLVNGKLEEGVTNPVEYTVETENFTLNNPIRIGYTFEGWTGSNGETPNKIVTIEKGTTGNKTFIANWISNKDTKYTVEVYEMNFDGEYIKVSSKEEKGETDTIVSVTPEPKEGFTYEEGLSTVKNKIAPDGSMILKMYYSRNTYPLIVKHYIENADNDEYTLVTTTTNTMKYGELITLSDYKIKITDATYNYGSLIDSKNGGTAVTTTTMGTGATIALYYNRDRYKLTLNKGDYISEVIGEGTYKIGQTVRINAILVPANTGYTNSFVKWESSNEELMQNINVQNTEIIIPRGDITLTAQGKTEINYYKLTINHYLENANDSNYTCVKITEATLAYGTQINYESYKENIENGTYSNGEGPTLIENESVINLYYIRNKYNVTLIAGDYIALVSGTGAYKVDQNVSVSATLKENESGYTNYWSGWSGTYTSSDNPFAFVMPAGDVSLTANGTRTANPYTLTVNPNGGIWGGVTTNSTFTQNYGTVKSISAPARNGYTFTGWTLYGVGTITKTLPIVSSYQTFTYGAGNSTIIAGWNVNNYTLTRIAETGGSVSGSSGNIAYGTSCTVTATASNGYSFAGWYEGTTRVSTNASYTFTMPANNRTLVAKFSVRKYTLTRTAETGGSVSGSSGSIAYGTSCTVTATASNGYRFAGWYEGTTRVSTNASYTFTMPANNRTLVAKFNVIQYTISYNANGGSGAPASQIKNHGTAITLSTTIPTRTDYIFLGWSTSSNATSATYKAGATYSAEGNQTLYAIWKSSVITFSKGTSINIYGPNSTSGKTVESTSAIIPAGAKVTFGGWIYGLNTGVGGSYTINFNNQTVKTETKYNCYNPSYAIDFSYTTSAEETLSISAWANSIEQDYQGLVISKGHTYIYIKSIVDNETGVQYTLK